MGHVPLNEVSVTVNAVAALPNSLIYEDSRMVSEACVTTKASFNETSMSYFFLIRGISGKS